MSYVVVTRHVSSKGNEIVHTYAGNNWTSNEANKVKKRMIRNNKNFDGKLIINVCKLMVIGD